MCTQASNIEFATFLVNKPEERSTQLHTFKHDPECRVLVLLMAHSSGAVSHALTLTQDEASCGGRLCTVLLPC